MARWKDIYAGSGLIRHMAKDSLATPELVKEYNNEVKATWRIPSDLFKELKHLAIDENVPVNDLVTKALKEFLRKSKK